MSLRDWKRVSKDKWRKVFIKIFVARYFSMVLSCLYYFCFVYFYLCITFVFRDGKEIDIKLNIDLARAVITNTF